MQISPHISSSFSVENKKFYVKQFDSLKKSVLLLSR